MKRFLLLTLAFSLFGGTFLLTPDSLSASGPLCGAYTWCRDGQYIQCFGEIGYDACYSAPGCWIMCDGNATFCNDRSLDCPLIY